MKHLTLALVIVLALLAVLVDPLFVRADGETPPPPTETPFPTETPLTTVMATTEPVSTEVPVTAENPVDPTAVIETAFPVSETPENNREPQPALTDILQEIPADTSIVVLDENGQSLPLVFQEAAEIIAEGGDPVWCPTGKLPGDSECSTSFASLSALVASFVPNGDGTIWIQTGLQGGGAVTIDGSGTWSAAKDYTLTLQGGWNGVSGSSTIGSNSEFSVPIKITNWQNSVAINNIDTTDSINITTSIPSAIISNLNVKNVKATNLNVSNIKSSNIFIDVVQGNVDINNVNADSIQIYNVGENLSISNTTTGVFKTISYTSGKTIKLNENTVNKGGAYIDAWKNSLNISDSNFIHNSDYGLWVFNGWGNTVITNSNFNDNAGTGLWLIPWGASINISGGEITRNLNGLVVAHCSSIKTDETNPPQIGYNKISDIVINDCYERDITYSIPVIPVSGSGQTEFELDCSHVNAFAVRLPNGDLVNIFCPVSGTATIYRLDSTVLPANLPEGYTYSSGFTLNIRQKDSFISEIKEGGYIKATFVAPDLQLGETYSVLYWDIPTNSWIPLKDFMLDANSKVRPFTLSANPLDTREIISGVRYVTNPNGVSHVEVSVNFPGIFVLAQH